MVARDWLSDEELEAALQEEIADLIWHVRARHPRGNRKVRVVPTFSMYMDVFSDALTLAGNPWSPEDVAREFEHCYSIGGVPPDLIRAPQYIRGLRSGKLVPNKPFRDTYQAGKQSLNEIGTLCGWMRNGKQVSDTSRVQRALGLKRTMPSVKDGKRYERATVRLWIPSDDAALLAQAMGLVPVEVGI